MKVAAAVGPSATFTGEGVHALVDLVRLEVEHRAKTGGSMSRVEREALGAFARAV